MTWARETADRTGQEMGHEAESSTGPGLLGAGDIRSLAARLGLRPSKQRGQNFVTDANTIRRIVRAAGVTPADTVLEIGPGLGSLTLGLLDVARQVVAVEVDPLLAEALPETIGRHAPGRAGRLTVVQADALQLAADQVRDVLRQAQPEPAASTPDVEPPPDLGPAPDADPAKSAPVKPADSGAAHTEAADTEAADTEAADTEAADTEAADTEAADTEAADTEAADTEAADTEAADTEAGRMPGVLVANLPYNVAVPVLLHTLREFPDIDHGLVMVQLEVAERLAAPPGGKVYGVPSAKMAWYAETRQAGLVGRGVFWPQPRVDSGLVAFTRRRPPRTSASREQVFAVVEAAFAQRRKTLRAALAGLFGSPGDAEEALRAAGVDPGARGERLDIVEFARVAEQLPPEAPPRGPDGSRGATHTPGAPS